MQKIKALLLKVWMYIKTVLYKFKGLSRRSFIVIAYLAIIFVLSGILITRMTGGGRSVPETEFEKEPESTINVEELFDSVEERAIPSKDETDDPIMDTDINDGHETESQKEQLISENHEQNGEREEEESAAEQSEQSEQDEQDEQDEPDEPAEPVSAEEVPQGFWPVKGDIIATHGSLYQINNQYRFHNGIDIEAVEGAPVRAAWNGTVEQVAEDPALGLKMKVTSEGYTATYANLSSVLVSEEDFVSAGEQIATVGNSATLDMSEGYYLHFSVNSGTNTMDPEQLLPDDSH